MKRQANEGFPLIPEGEQVVCIDSIDESKYAKFQKLTVVIKDAAGAAANVNFNFVKDDGTPNEVADGIYTRMGRAALDDQTLDEIDSDELIGKFVTVEIEHNEGTKGGTFANVKKWIGPGEPFKRSSKPATASPSAKTATPEHKRKSAAEILAEAKAKRAAAAK